MKIKQILFTSVLTSLLLMSAAFSSFGATKKKITSVSLKAKSHLEVGQSVDSGDVIEGDPADGEIGVWEESDKYTITELKITHGTGKELKVGQEVKVRVVLEVDDDDYIFKSGLSKSNVHVSGDAECTSVSRNQSRLTLTLTFKAAKGEYDSPSEAYWKDSGIGKAVWKKPDGSGSGHYEVILKRGGTIVFQLEDTTETSYNFYPYMNKKGSYYFRVRTVPSSSSSKKYGKKSEWTDSEEVVLDEDEVSDGRGAKDKDGNSLYVPAVDGVGWYKEAGCWYYRYPNGRNKTNGWEKILDKWYYFEGSGKMKTGWHEENGIRYYLGLDGAMVTGWNNIGEVWYYFNEDASKGPVGRLESDRQIGAGQTTGFINARGERASGWVKIGDHYSYFDPDTGIMARDCYVGTFYVDADGIWRQ